METGDSTPSESVAVVGAGTMGRRIALMWANQGGEVRVHEPDAAQRDEAQAFVAAELPAVVEQVGGRSGHVTMCDDLDRAVQDAWMVVEAIPERLELKQALFGRLDRIAPADAILVSNSSSYPTSQMIGEVTRPERVVNTHYYLPPRLNAVEIMSCGQTDPAIIDRLLSVMPDHGLVPFHVQRESVGFIYNRIWAAIKREALEVVAEGVSTPADVDQLFILCTGAPIGPFRRMDEVGLDVVLDIEKHYAEIYPNLPEGPRRLLAEYIQQGRLGKKSGCGFFGDYGERDYVKTPRPVQGDAHFRNRPRPHN
jgi:3-hydroxybutyryl-CoA dehydrogenase